MAGYQYPLRADWSTEEIVKVIDFFNKVEQAFESSVERDEFMKYYRAFKSVVPSMAEEKTLCKEFEESSGYVSFRAVKAAKEGRSGELLKLKK
ncbi:hypothetical protein SporoP37_13920 [Sporosarcina sp. P37]|uniref:UPF0223 family protein n=1 Tax=unclassified Sporosarcina TaxID=2647733 RepID=UPI0009C02210|nr:MULTISPECIES: UPF0223 family protein [unclassified Sporosarcina]ARD49164.1 hypothetical protein SporoP33_13580 [Sporosarcina sp. P33]ARK25641.1 hypothetical protein SporoP37_13920 [Sporosarcina sp. P37]PID18042.1 hypothetical protein CSV62_10525 [Sporosarcina sp. P35]